MYNKQLMNLTDTAMKLFCLSLSFRDSTITNIKTLVWAEAEVGVGGNGFSYTEGVVVIARKI